jgi:hypothetical protein
MSYRSEVFAVLQRYKEGFDEYDDEKVRDCFVWPCTALVNGNTITLTDPPRDDRRYAKAEKLAPFY